MFAPMWKERLSGVKSDEVFIKHILDEIGFLKTHSRNLELEFRFNLDNLFNVCMRKKFMIFYFLDTSSTAESNLLKIYLIFWIVSLSNLSIPISPFSTSS